jgi:ABC-2 type transport system permease protein
MWTILRYALKRNLPQILGWGIGMAALAAYLMVLYDTWVAQKAQFASLLEAYPPELMAAFGGTADLFTEPGFLNFTFYSYIILVIGIYICAVGSGLLAEDEENGRLDLILAHPISRTELFYGRLLSMVLSLAAILTLTWVGFAAFLPSTSLEVNSSEMALPLIDLFFISMVFGTFSLALSMFLPSRRMAVMLSSLVLLASYLVKTLVTLDENIEKIQEFTPLYYSKGGYAIQGLNWGWILGLLIVSLVFVLLAWQRFEHKDIRVAGEGSWRIPLLQQKTPPAQSSG